MSLGAALSPVFSPLVNTNILPESQDDLDENLATSNDVHPLRQMPHNVVVRELCRGFARWVRGLADGVWSGSNHGYCTTCMLEFVSLYFVSGSASCLSKIGLPDGRCRRHGRENVFGTKKKWSGNFRCFRQKEEV